MQLFRLFVYSVNTMLPELCELSLEQPEMHMLIIDLGRMGPSQWLRV